MKFNTVAGILFAITVGNSYSFAAPGDCVLSLAELESKADTFVESIKKLKDIKYKRPKLENGVDVVNRIQAQSKSMPERLDPSQLFAKANSFKEIVTIDLQKMLAALDFYSIGFQEPIASFSVNADLNLALFHLHEHTSQKIVARTFSARIHPTGHIQFLNWVAVGTDGVAFSRPEFVENTNIARIRKSVRSTAKGPSTLDFQFVDVNKDQKLRSLSEGMSKVFSHVTYLSDNIYYGEIAETKNFIIVEYHPSTGAFHKYFEGPITAAIADILGGSESVKAEALNNNEVVVRTAKIDFVFNRREPDFKVMAIRPDQNSSVRNSSTSELSEDIKPEKFYRHKLVNGTFVGLSQIEKDGKKPKDITDWSLTIIPAHLQQTQKQ